MSDIEELLRAELTAATDRINELFNLQIKNGGEIFHLERELELSNIENDKLKAKLSKCTKCHGRGELDDSEPDGIFFRSWTCQHCRGSGKEPDPVDGLTPTY